MPEVAARDWLEICPNLTIGQNFNAKALSYDARHLSQIASDLHTRGYLSLPAQFSTSELQPLIEGMNALKARNIAPVYIYMFDQPWFLFEKLRALLAYLLGDEYALLPNFWAWHLAAAGEAGWPAHRDCDAQTVFDIGGDKLLMSLSLWVPLSDVDEANGCMHVVEYNNENGAEGSGDMATPLPAEAGSVLGWAQDVLHFGGIFSEDAKNPRLSLSFEFQNTAFEPLAVPLLSTKSPPKFEDRQQLLKDQFEKYRHIDPALSEI
jgi:hypothetical protein